MHGEVYAYYCYSCTCSTCNAAPSMRIFNTPDSDYTTLFDGEPVLAQLVDISNGGWIKMHTYCPSHSKVRTCMIETNTCINSQDPSSHFAACAKCSQILSSYKIIYVYGQLVCSDGVSPRSHIHRSMDQKKGRTDKLTRMRVIHIYTPTCCTNY